MPLFRSSVGPSPCTWTIRALPRSGGAPSTSFEERGHLEPLLLERVLLRHDLAELGVQLPQPLVVGRVLDELVVQLGLALSNLGELPVDPRERLARLAQLRLRRSPTDGWVGGAEWRGRPDRSPSGVAGTAGR